ncbi:Nucleolar complex protein 2, partial [Kappamyces sp. JEL0680]
FNLVILTAIKYTPIVLDSYLYGEKEEAVDAVASVKKPLPASSKKWKNVRLAAKTFLTSLLKVLHKMTSLSMQRFVVKTTEQIVAYFCCFPKLVKDFHKAMLGLWASSAHEQVRILAFLVIRRLALTAPNSCLDMCIKKSYQTFLSAARVTTVHTWTQLAFMDNCIVELCGLFLASTYQHAFVSLRQLAIQLRQASTTRTKENFKSVYNWQYLHALRVWAHVLCSYGPEQDPKHQLKPLIYPLVQIIIGVMRSVDPALTVG